MGIEEGRSRKEKRGQRLCHHFGCHRRTGSSSLLSPASNSLPVPRLPYGLALARAQARISSPPRSLLGSSVVSPSRSSFGGINGCRNLPLHLDLQPSTQT
ncbi:hypothetical protein CRG98_031652 [Punica granatum]|uniref:Uncharacterized protein n=1 Tax=Punica granatum TaxID=22663 RepID=A0A2I0IVG1_PUNGR|nr:hypothetical protein CRG98_031652 [Punica granatum]